MSILIIDASVAVKWLLPEPLRLLARQLRLSNHQLHAPAFLDVEVANVLWKKVRKGEVNRERAGIRISKLPALPLTRHPDASLVEAAFDLANRLGRTVYDCLYLALAVQLGGMMVTADERFINSLANTAWAPFVIHLQDVPTTSDNK